MDIVQKREKAECRGKRVGLKPVEGRKMEVCEPSHFHELPVPWPKGASKGRVKGEKNITIATDAFLFSPPGPANNRQLRTIRWEDGYFRGISTIVLVRARDACIVISLSYTLHHLSWFACTMTGS